MRSDASLLRLLRSNGTGRCDGCREPSTPRYPVALYEIVPNVGTTNLCESCVPECDAFLNAAQADGALRA
ncbi:MAG: hypothetical protein ACLPYS_10405 [Vulcanimicrobiaceae bacterium]